MRYLVEIEVDEDTLRNSDGELDVETSIEGLIEREMGWVSGSGISVINVDNLSDEN